MVTIKVENSTLVTFLCVLLLFVGFTLVFAYNSGSSPIDFGHSSEELMVIAGGTTKTLQQAIDAGDFSHGSNELMVIVGGTTKTLQQAIDAGDFSHSSNELMVTVGGTTKSLQQAIDAGDFGSSGIGAEDCSWHKFVTHGSYTCPAGYYVSGVCTTNSVDGCDPGGSGAQNQWVAAGGVRCCRA